MNIWAFVGFSIICGLGFRIGWAIAEHVWAWVVAMLDWIFG